MSEAKVEHTGLIVPCADVLPRERNGSSNLPDDQREVLEQILDESVTAMLQAYGLHTPSVAERSDRAGSTQCVAAFIGFWSESVRGALVVIVPMQLLARTHPLRDHRSMSESDAADWSCEFANQLLSRMKLKLLRRDLVIEIGTPQGVVADSLRLGQSSRSELIVRCYNAEEFELLVCFDLAIGAGVVLFDASKAPAEDIGEVPLEGDAILF